MSIDTLLIAIEKPLAVHQFVDTLLQFFAPDYAIDSAAPPDTWFDNWLSLSGNKVTSRYYSLTGRVGRYVPDYGDSLFSRISISVFSAKTEADCDSLWKNLLARMEVKYPLGALPIEAVKAPPFILIRDTRALILAMFRCVDFADNNGIGDPEAFWRIARDISDLISGYRAEYVLGCFCGGPLRSLMN